MNHLYAFLENKTIAVIGNGPQEIGTANGSKIDSYDIVIRFNYYQEGLDRYGKDYGHKTHIWCCDRSLRNIPPLSNTIEYILCPNDYLFDDFRWEVINFYHSSHSKGCNVYAIPSLVLDELNSKHNMLSPSSGLRVVSMLNQMNLIKKEDIYGFSFKTEDMKKNVCEHFWGDSSIWLHNFDKESQIISNIFQ